MSRSSKWLSPERRAAIYLRDNFRCVYCQRRPERSRWRHPWTDPAISVGLTLDHVVPECRGGTHVSSNVVTCCERCNDSKQTSTLEAWLESVRDLVLHPPQTKTAPSPPKTIARQRAYAESLVDAEGRVEAASSAPVSLVDGKRFVGARATRPLPEFKKSRKKRREVDVPF